MCRQLAGISNAIFLIKRRDDAYYEGAQRKLRQQIKVKLAKGKNAEEIADDLEEDVETIQTLIKGLMETPEKL